MYITKLVNEQQDLIKYDIIKSILSDVKIIKIQSSLNHVILKCRYGSHVKYNWILNIQKSRSIIGYYASGIRITKKCIKF
jgi:hypothetical protein